MKTVANYNGEQVGNVIHIFERAGLGKAPFQFVGVNENVYKAHPDAPAQPGGTCDYCGQGIRYECVIRSKDGKIFKVGCDCVNKTDDNGLRRITDAKVRELKRVASHRTQDARIERAKAALPNVAEALKKIKHSQDWRAAQGQTRYDEVVWYLANAGRAGKLWAARIIEGELK